MNSSIKCSEKNNKKILITTTIIGSIANVLLTIVKISIGFLYNSHSLMLDGFHSLTDLVTDVFVLIISNYSQDAPDEEHPYGHDKIETIGTLALGSILMATSGALLYEIIERFINTASHNIIQPSKITLYAAALSIVVKELLYQYQVRIGNKHNSPIIIANAWHHRSDSFSSIAVFIGIIFSIYGYPIFDSIASLFVVLLIGKVAWDFIKDSIVELIETSISAEDLTIIREAIKNCKGVNSFHNLRSRKVGMHAFIDVNVEVSPLISVSEGHQIGHNLIHFLQSKLEYVRDITVHVDTENDQDDYDNYINNHNNNIKPLRDDIISDLHTSYQQKDFFEKIIDYHFHYSKDGIDVFIYFNLSDANRIGITAKQLKQKCKNIKYLKNIVFFFKQDVDVKI